MEQYCFIQGKLGTGKNYNNIKLILSKYNIEGKLQVADSQKYIDTIESLILKRTKPIFIKKRGEM